MRLREGLHRGDDHARLLGLLHQDPRRGRQQEGRREDRQLREVQARLVSGPGPVQRVDPETRRPRYSSTKHNHSFTISTITAAAMHHEVFRSSDFICLTVLLTNCLIFHQRLIPCFPSGKLKVVGRTSRLPVGFVLTRPRLPIYSNRDINHAVPLCASRDRIGTLAKASLK